MSGEALEYLAQFADARLQEVEVEGVDLFEEMEPVGIQLKGDPNLVPDQMMFSFSIVLKQVILTLNEQVLVKIEGPHLSPSLLQNAAAGAVAVGVAHLFEQRQGRPLSSEEQRLVCQAEVERIGNLMRALAEKHDVTGQFLHGDDIQRLD